MELWSEVLGVEASVAGVEVSFFDLGGHSLKATVLLGRIQKELGVKVPVARSNLSWTSLLYTLSGIFHREPSCLWDASLTRVRKLPMTLPETILVDIAYIHKGGSIQRRRKTNISLLFRHTLVPEQV